MANDTAGAASTDNLDKAADRLRDSAKWLVGAFGALATVVFAGLTVSNLGKLDTATPGHRLLMALVGGLVAVVAIAYALAVAMRLASASTTSVKDLTRDANPWEYSLKNARSEVRADPALAPWDGDPAGLVADHEAAYGEYVRWVKAYAASSSTKPSRAQVDKAEFRLGALAEVMGRIQRTTSFLRLQHAFGRARVAIVFAMVFAAVGAGAFAWATNSIPNKPPTLVVDPVPGTMHPGKPTLDDINRQVPADCQFKVGDQAAAVVLGVDDDKKTYEVLVGPKQSGCPYARAQAVPQAEVVQTAR